MIVSQPKRVGTKYRNILQDTLRETAEFFRHNGRIDWIGFSYPLAAGLMVGAAGLLLLVTTRSTATTASSLVLVGVLGALLGAVVVGLGSLLLVLVITCIEQTCIAGDPARRRRADLRNEIRYLRKAVRSGSVPLEDIEQVTVHLRIRDGHEPNPDAGLRERLRWKRLRRWRRRVDSVLEASWLGSLPTAVGMLRAAYAAREQRPLVVDDIPTAWYLERTPPHAAVRRLLAEYTPSLRDERTGNIVFFNPGVVFTPRWVYELARAGARQVSYSHMALPSSVARRSRGGIGDECVDVGSADRETVAKLYDHDGNGPMKSLWDTIEAAKRL